MVNNKLSGFSLKKRSFSDTKKIIVSITYKIKFFYLIYSSQKTKSHKFMLGLFVQITEKFFRVKSKFLEIVKSVTYDLKLVQQAIKNVD